MLNLAYLNAISIIGPQNNFFQNFLFLTNGFNRKKNERIKCLIKVINILEKIKSELNDKMNGKPTLVENLAFGLLEIVECKKIILYEVEMQKDKKLKIQLNNAVENLTQIKAKWEERINGKIIEKEGLVILKTNVEECITIIAGEIKSLNPQSPISPIIGT